MIAIIDYEGGNLTSVQRAVRRVGHEAVITRDPLEIEKASRLIFPGVGAAGAAMDVLKDVLVDARRELVLRMIAASALARRGGDAEVAFLNDRLANEPSKLVREKIRLALGARRS